jgi:hypothetical protein
VDAAGVDSACRARTCHVDRSLERRRDAVGADEVVARSACDDGKLGPLVHAQQAVHHFVDGPVAADSDDQCGAGPRGALGEVADLAGS